MPVRKVQDKAAIGDYTGETREDGPPLPEVVQYDGGSQLEQVKSVPTRWM